VKWQRLGWLDLWLLLDQAIRRSHLEHLQKTNNCEKRNSLPAAIERVDDEIKNTTPFYAIASTIVP
jgi:hypothetical protein